MDLVAKLQDPNAPDFLKLLTAALPSITPSNAHDFYDLMLGHTTEDLEPERLRGITVAICHTFMNKDNKKLFVENKFYRRLPYSKLACGPSILDILYFSIKHSPDVLSSSILKKLDEFARRAPCKVLTLFALAFHGGQNTIFADFLIEKTAYFTVPRAINDYISLLISLVLGVEELTGDFAASVGDILRDALTSDSDDTLTLCYNSLCHLADLSSPVRIPVPVPLLVTHIARLPVQDAVVSFLLRYPPRRGNLWPLLERLIALARTSTRCAYILLKMSSTPATAELLVENPQWMTLNLPQLRFTVNLFCHVFVHQELRPRIAGKVRELAHFLVALRGLSQPGGRPDATSVPIVCTILRRIEIEPVLLQLLSQNSFIRSFFQIAREAEEDFRAFIVLRLFADVGMFPEMLGLCDWVVEKLRGDVKIAKAAAQAAVSMAAYRQCKDKFRNVRLGEILLRQRRTTGVFGTLLDAIKP